jgi:hypothetical protein
MSYVLLAVAVAAVAVSFGEVMENHPIAFYLLALQDYLLMHLTHMMPLAQTVPLAHMKYPLAQTVPLAHMVPVVHIWSLNQMN